MAFGIDCAAYATDGPLTKATAAWGKPSFCGRYLPNYAITRNEAVAILGAGCRILPLWNGITSATCALGHDFGFQEGQRAAAAWRALGAPAGCAIYLDIEAEWWPSPSCLQGWMEGAHSGGMIGGVYLNPLQEAHVQAYQQARAATTAPSAQFTAQNELYVNQDRPVSEFRIATDGAAAVPGYERECHVWQTWENSLGGLVDLDCADEVGLTLMWGATPPPVPAPVKRGAPVAPRPCDLVEECALKPEPDHTSTALTETDQPAAEAQALPWTHVVADGEIWQRVRWRDVEGWVLQSNCHFDGPPFPTAAQLTFPEAATATPAVARAEPAIAEAAAPLAA